MRIRFFLFLIILLSDLCAQQAVVDNGVVRREIELKEGHVVGKKYVLLSDGTGFIREGAKEFSLKVNDKTYTGASDWADIRCRDTTDAQGKGIVISFSKPDKSMKIELIYMSYPQLPVIRKSLAVVNTGHNDLKVESVDVENFRIDCNLIESWVLRQYARHRWLGPYVGNWDDPLVVIHDMTFAKGMAVGNEAIGVVKRTSAFTDGRTVTAGLTHSDQDYPFRKWLRPGERWVSPWVFTAVYNNCTDPQMVVNTSVQDFVRKHMGTRIEQLPRKPMFVYNTWHPFTRNINEKMILELAKAAAECGVEEFIIDDGWQCSEHTEDERFGAWEADKEKFPNGLKPVFDEIKSLGMKPGLWVSLAIASPSTPVYKEHPEWFVIGSDGKPANLHSPHGKSLTTCMGTDWYDHIKNAVLRLVREYGLGYIKLDFAVVASAYVYDVTQTGCYAENHPHHRDRAESFEVIYKRCMQLFDELHTEAPDLFIDCTFETAAKLQLMDYGIARHAEGNWLSNIRQPTPTGSLRMRNLAWGRSPALPATSLVIGNLQMDEKGHELGFKSLAGALPIMLGDPRKLSSAERRWYKSWTDWLKELEARHGYMSFRQDLPGFGEPTEGAWDGFCRINTDTGSGGLIGVFNQGSREKSRMVTIPWLKSEKTYQVKQGFGGKVIATASGKKLKEEGFQVVLSNLYDGELFEVVLKNN